MAWPDEVARTLSTVDRTSLATGLDFPGVVFGTAIDRSLSRIAFVGTRHRTGEDLDRDEVAVLRELTRAAAAAYQRVEADALRQELGEASGTSGHHIPQLTAIASLYCFDGYSCCMLVPRTAMSRRTRP